jgi:hypothetical protein
MNPTPLQIRKLNQLQNEVLVAEAQLKKRNIWFAIRFAWVIAMGSYIVGYFFDAIVEGQTLVEYVNDYGWASILRDFLFWFVFNYFAFSSNRQLLNKSKKELQAYEAKLAKETGSSLPV